MLYRIHHRSSPEPRNDKTCPNVVCEGIQGGSLQPPASVQRPRDTNLGVCCQPQFGCWPLSLLYFDAPFSEFDIDLVTRIQGHQQPADGPRPPPRKPSRLALTLCAVHAALAPAHRPMIAPEPSVAPGRRLRSPTDIHASHGPLQLPAAQPRLSIGNPHWLSEPPRTRNSRAIAEPCLGTRHLSPRRRVLFSLPCFQSALKLDQPPCLSDHSLPFPLSQPLPEPKEPFPAQANPQTHTQDKPANPDRPK